MNEPKTFASLSPSLLARKGAAKPAMRPQLQPMQQFHEATARQLDMDDTYNDFGDEDTPVHEAEVVELKPSAHSGQVPEVVHQLQCIAERVNDAPRRRKSALAQGRSAAFTLRLDVERHFKLRLACTLVNRSAQQIVTEALDKFIAEQPEVAELAAQVGKRH